MECRFDGALARGNFGLRKVGKCIHLLIFPPGRFSSGVRDSSLCSVAFDDTPGGSGGGVGSLSDWLSGQTY